MKMIFLISLLVSTHIVVAQNKEWLSLYAGVNNSVTLEDITRQNNPWGLGIFTSAYANTGGWLRPTIEITTEGFINDEEVMVFDGADGVYPRIDAMISLMGGAAIRFERFLSIGFVTGPALLKIDDSGTAFITNKRLWVIKPNIDITPGKGKLTFRLGYVKASSRFQAASPTRYKSLTVGVGVRLIGK